MATCLPHCVLLGCMYICVHASITLCVFECMCVCARVCVHSVLPGKDLQKSFLHNWRFFSSSLTYCWVRLFGSEQCLFLQGGLALTTVCVCVFGDCVCTEKQARRRICLWACAFAYVSVHLDYLCQHCPTPFQPPRAPGSKCWYLIPCMMMTCIITCSSRHIM